MTLLQSTEQAIELAEIAADARDYAAASRAENTTRVYRTGWAQFTAWCDEHRVVALPAGADTVACFVADLAKDAKPATIDLRLAAISAAHRAAGHDSPTKEEAVRLVRRGVRRTLGTAQRQVRPLTVPELRTMLEGLGTDPAGCRGRALLLLGFAGALRRSELIGLDVGDITEGSDGLTVRLRRSKRTRRALGAPLASLTGRSRQPARSVPGVRGSRSQASQKELPSAPWTVMGTSAQHDSARKRWPSC